MTQLSHSSPVILDACCLINLGASGQISEILSKSEIDWFTPKYILENEILEISGEHGNDQTLEIAPLLSQGILKTVMPENETEEKNVISLMQLGLDDGESYSIGIAQSRNWSLATDDRAAIRYSSVSVKPTPPCASA